MIPDAKDSDQRQASEADAGPEIVQAAVGPSVCHTLFARRNETAAHPATTMRGSHDSCHRQVSVEQSVDIDW